MRTRHIALGILAGSAVFAPAILSSAQTAPAVAPERISARAQVLQIGSGNDGRLDGEMKRRYPGFEQSTVTAVGDHIVVVTMRSMVTDAKAGTYGPNQLACSSWQLQANGPPKQVADLKQLTNYSGGGQQRLANHPKIATDGKYVVLGYGSDYNNNRPNTYVMALDKECNILTQPQMISVPRDANDGAFDITFNGVNAAGKSIFTSGYYSDGNNGPGVPVTGAPVTPAEIKEGGDYSFAVGLALTPGAVPTLERTYMTPIVTPSDIGRPAIQAIDANRSVYCAAKGPDRPSDDIECGVVNANDGKVLWKGIVAKGDRKTMLYFNQPTVAKVGDKIIVSALESSGQRKNNNNVKGSNISHLLAFEIGADNAMNKVGEIVGASVHQTHSAICSGAYGEGTNQAVGVLSASPSGVGRASMAMVNFDANAKTFKYDQTNDTWPVSWYGDSGHLANIYGENPMRQGRDFLRCIGDVPNPGYKQVGGFMPEVKSFFVATVHGRIPGNAKNSLFVSLVPGASDKPLTPENPVNAGTKSEADPGIKPPAAGPEDSNGCGCTTPGRTQTSGFAAVGLALALGAVVYSRKRSEKR